ncbi:hypothetical protein AUC68_08760 [Methyloceanibacter methanicus]|uniref:Uncharacterized protein n=1 Tax=Methyloceanibacter methanicus TaxID=1774968 RepID=A0A1E3VY75_9HYPH|nr:hypothetical protein [Methyloceanibacter methanicus]ODR98505.1 hypothetical protein AUC68_08760 [Methyloceanibacter methanicus]
MVIPADNDKEGWQPSFIDIEAQFTDFVGTFRQGTKVTDVGVPIPEGALNADFYFPQDHVIAELKCLETDSADATSQAKRVVACFKHFGYSGDALLDCILRGKPVPDRVARRLASIRARSIVDAIKKANKQIGSTKQILDKQNAEGLVLLANDRNLGFDPRQMMAIICKAFPQLSPCHTDCVVYFTPNVYHDRGDGIAYTLWTPIYNVGSEDFSDFVNAIGAAWGDYAEALGDSYLVRETGGEELFAQYSASEPIAKFKKP